MYSVTTVQTRKEMRDFLQLPIKLHGDEPSFVPNLIDDDARMFDPARNPATAYSSYCCWIARDGSGRVVGRIAGIINHRYNALRQETNGRFSHLDAIDDIEVIRLLLETVTQWAKLRGMNQVVGPLGFTDQDPEGFMIEGFDEAPSIVTYCNNRYLVDALAKLGCSKLADYVVYKVPLPAQRPPAYERLLERVKRRGDLRVVEFTSRKQLKPFTAAALALMNETYQDILGYSPLSAAEIEDLTKRFMPMIDARFVKTVFAGDLLVGFVIGVPDMARGFQQAKGRLFPFGWWRILQSAKHARRLDLLLGGIKREYRGRGVDLLMATAMFASAEAAGYEYMDSHHELEDNHQVRGEMEWWGGSVYKRYRLFVLPAFEGAITTVSIPLRDELPVLH